MATMCVDFDESLLINIELFIQLINYRADEL